MINAFTVDLEYWYSAELLRGRAPSEKEHLLVESVSPILSLLKEYNTRATFFVLGKVAEEHPEIVERVAEEGHEIASHAYSHTRLHQLGREGFEKEIGKSLTLLEKITGKKPLGFRAPTFSLDNSTRWALPVLLDHGFRYDSSIFPCKTRLYGVPGAPLQPYRPSLDDLTREDPNSLLLEFPLSVLEMGWKIPVAGGFYLRALPLWFSRLAIKKINRTRPAIIYLHPWETYAPLPQVNGLSSFSRFVTYYGISSALGKIEALLQEFRFAPLGEMLPL